MSNIVLQNFTLGYPRYIMCPVCLNCGLIFNSALDIEIVKSIHTKKDCDNFLIRKTQDE